MAYYKIEIPDNSFFGTIKNVLSKYEKQTGTKLNFVKSENWYISFCESDNGHSQEDFEEYLRARAINFKEFDLEYLLNFLK